MPYFYICALTHFNIHICAHFDIYINFFLLCYQNSPFLILINWRILLRFSPSYHSSFNDNIGSPKKKKLTIFKKANYNIHQNWFSAFTNSFPYVQFYGASFFLYFSHYKKKRGITMSKFIFRPFGSNLSRFIFIFFPLYFQ